MHMSEITDLLAQMSADDRGARTLGVSTKTVNGDGLVARAWLRGWIPSIEMRRRLLLTQRSRAFVG